MKWKYTCGIAAKVVSHIEKRAKNCHGPGNLYIKEMRGREIGQCGHSATSARHRKCSVSQGMGINILLLPSAFRVHPISYLLAWKHFGSPRKWEQMARVFLALGSDSWMKTTEVRIAQAWLPCPGAVAAQRGCSQNSSSVTTIYRAAD